MNPKTKNTLQIIYLTSILSGFIWLLWLQNLILVVLYVLIGVIALKAIIWILKLSKNYILKLTHLKLNYGNRTRSLGKS